MTMEKTYSPKLRCKKCGREGAQVFGHLVGYMTGLPSVTFIQDECCRQTEYDWGAEIVTHILDKENHFVERQKP